MLARALLLSNLSPDLDPSMGRQFSRRRELAGGGAPGGPPSGGLSRPGRRAECAGLVPLTRLTVTLRP